jgi:UDP-glucose 4-epimerase
MPIYGDGHQTRDFVYVEDTVRGTLAAYAEPQTRGRAVNLATEMETTILDLVHAVYRGAATPVAFDYLAPRPGDVRRHLGSRELAFELFGFVPSVDLDDGMARTVAWYREKSSTLR